MRRTLVITCSVLCFFALASEAHAQRTVTSGTSGFEQIQRGVASIGLENMLLVHSNSAAHPDIPETDRTSLHASYAGGLYFRYFVMNNLSIGVSLGVLYQLNQETISSDDVSATTERSDLGFIGFLTANYYLRLGNSLFFNPGIGLGGLYATRTLPSAEGGDLVTQVKVYGGAARIDLGFTFFAGRHFSLHAGPQVVMRIGAEQPESENDEDVDSASFFTVDAGFEVGLAYTF